MIKRLSSKTKKTDIAVSKIEAAKEEIASQGKPSTIAATVTQIGAVVKRIEAIEEYLGLRGK